MNDGNASYSLLGLSTHIADMNNVVDHKNSNDCVQNVNLHRNGISRKDVK